MYILLNKNPELHSEGEFEKGIDAAFVMSKMVGIPYTIRELEELFEKGKEVNGFKIIKAKNDLIDKGNLIALKYWKKADLENALVKNGFVDSQKNVNRLLENTDLLFEIEDYENECSLIDKAIEDQSDYLESL